MTIDTSPSELFTPFLPTTYQVPEEADRLNTFLVDNFCDMSDVINDKVIGVFTDTVSSLNGIKASYDTTKKVRNGYNYLARIKSYPANGTITVSVPPDMSQQFAVFQMWGSATRPLDPNTPGMGDYFSFFGSGNPKISFTFTDIAITVTTTGLGAGYSGFICVQFIADGQ